MSSTFETRIIDVKSTPVDSASIVLAMESRRRELSEALRPHQREQQSFRADGAEPGQPHTNNGGPDLAQSGEHHSTDTPQSKASIWLPIGKTLLAQWWQHHPARIGIQIAEQSIEKQARAHPIALLAVGAVLGSAIVMIKPWRRTGIASLVAGVVGAKSAGSLSKILEIAKAVTRAT